MDKTILSSGQKQAEEADFKLDDGLEQRVRSRTEELEKEILRRRRAEENLEKERKRMEVILSALNTGLSLINPDMTIAWVNQKIREMFPGREPVGQVCHLFYESRATICDGCGTVRAFMDGNVCESEQLVPATGRWYYIVSQPIKDTDGRVVNVLEGITDITGRKQIEEEIHQQAVELEQEVAERQMAQETLQEQALLLESEIEKRRNALDELEQLNNELEQRAMLAELSAGIGCDLTASGNLRDMLKQCSESLVRHLDVAFARIWTFNDAENVLELQASAGMYTRIDGSHSVVPVGKFKIGLIAEERKPHISNDVQGDPRVHDQKWAKREGMVAFAGHPLVIGDKLVGVMAMFSRNRLSDVSLKALESVSSEIAIGIEHKLSEEALHRLNRELRAISDCNQLLVRAEDEQTLLGEICRIICDGAGYRMAWVGFAENDDARTVRPKAWAGFDDGYLADARITWDDTEYGRGPSGIAIRTGKTDFIHDFATEPKAAPWRKEALQRGFRSSISLPLKDEDARAFGVLNIYSTEINAFTPDEIRLLEELAGDLAFGIQALRNRIARRESERNVALLSSALDNVQEAAFLTDGQGRFDYVNEESCRVLGYRRDELLGMGVADVDPDFPPERWPEHWAELKNRRSLTFETRHKTKEGRVFQVEINANYLEFEGRDYNLALARDVTGRKRMEDALFFVAQRGWLADAENFFDALAQYLGENLDIDYVVIDRMDENPDIAETIALYAKGAIVPNMRYALKGTPCENVMGRQLCVYPQDVQHLFPEDTLLAEMGVESYIGIPLWGSSGQPIGLIALMDGKPLPDAAAATQLLQLVATRAAAELAREQSDRILRTREHEFRSLAENLPDNIVRYDREGRSVYVNPVLEKTLGAAAADMIGKQVREIHRDGSYEVYAQVLDATLSSGENGEFELILPVPGEEPIVHQIRMIAERDDHDEVTGVLAIGRDITERRRMEEELRKLNEGLEQQVLKRTMELEEKNAELARMNKIFVGRELRMIELKERIKELEGGS